MRAWGLDDHWKEEKRPWVSAHTTSGNIQGVNSGNFQNHLYRGLTWTHTNPSYVAILSQVQGYCEPEAPSEMKGSSPGNSTEGPCSSDIYSLKALPHRRQLLFLNCASNSGLQP